MDNNKIFRATTAIFILLIFMVSCTSNPQEEARQNLLNEKYLVLSPDEYHDLLLTKGELVYVPVYSEIFGANLESKIKLSATLSIRNITPDNEIIVSKVDYYDTHGKLIRHYLSDPIVLNPLETVSYLVEHKDTKGGDGANFIVEWAAEQEVPEPIIEAVMIGSSSALGISFTCQGKVVKYLNK
jgi:hypothetical protein